MKKTLLHLKIYLISLSSILLFGCPNSMPPFDGKWYAGDSVRAGIARSQSDEFIPANSPDFDNYACMSYDDIKKLILIINSCQSWKKKKNEK